MKDGKLLLRLNLIAVARATLSINFNDYLTYIKKKIPSNISAPLLQKKCTRPLITSTKHTYIGFTLSDL